MSLKTAIKKILYGTGYYHLKCRFDSSISERLLIVMYHDLVEDDAHDIDWTQRAEPRVGQFRAQLTTLKKCARILTVADAVKEIREHGRLKERSIAITFDDGLESNYRLGLPILKELEVPATIFLPTDWINNRMSFWWLKLADVMKRLDSNRATVAEVYACLEVEGGTGSHSLADEQSRLRLFYALEDHLRVLATHEADERVSRLNDLPVDNNIAPAKPTRPMTWDQIREMSQHGIDFGAHTVSHPNLSFINPADAESEFRSCKKEIEERLDKPVFGLAYPYGVDYHTYTKLTQVVQKADFLYALTAVAGYNDHRTNPYLLRRINLPITSSAALIGREVLLDYQLNNDVALARSTGTN